MTVTRIEELEIWKLARELTIELHATILTSKGFSEDCTLRNQINRSAGSIMDNIAEVFERKRSLK